MKINWDHWRSATGISAINYVCGYCGNKVGSHTGYYHETSSAKIYICPECGFPSLFCAEMQVPGPLLGREIKNLPDDVGKIYFEIRESIKNNILTGAILLGRKLIMHIAVSATGAPENKTFEFYINHLKEKNYIPPNGEKILEYIRKTGNQKNHQIKIGILEEAEKILRFIEGLLIFIYEFPSEFEEK